MLEIQILLYSQLKNQKINQLIICLLKVFVCLENIIINKIKCIKDEYSNLDD